MVNEEVEDEEVEEKEEVVEFEKEEVDAPGAEESSNDLSNHWCENCKLLSEGNQSQFQQLREAETYDNNMSPIACRPYIEKIPG